jgi:N-acetylneuraminic acid mutarotase
MRPFIVSITFCCLVFLYNGGNTSYGTTYNWSQLNDFGGSVRFGVYSFVIGNYGYFGGGYANGVNVSDMWQFDPSNNIWTQKSNLPQAIRLGGSFSLNGLGYTVCGVAANNVKIPNVYAYDPVTNSWITKANYPGVPIFGGTSFVINNRGYYGIGNGGSATGPYYTAFYEYNPVADSWLQKLAFPGIPRYGSFGFSINGKGYAGFGKDDGLQSVYDDWYEYDPVINSWTAKATFIAGGRSYPCGFVLNNIGYVACGLIGSGSHMNDFFTYNPIADSWTNLSNFPGVGRWVGSGFAIGDTGYIGTGSDDINYFRDFWKYAADSTTAIKESTLYDISIYPNPCLDKLSLNFSKSAFIKSIQVLNAEGEILFAEKIEDILPEIYELNLSQMAEAIYFVKVNFENSAVVKKVFKR